MLPCDFMHVSITVNIINSTSDFSEYLANVITEVSLINLIYW